MKFSCIIPAYNEGPRIASIIRTALDCEELDEVIVVDDGSTDETWNVINAFDHPKLKKIHQANTGKTGAVFAGIRCSKGDYIVMIDSDLLNLTRDHIGQLIQPIQEGQVHVTISIRENSLLIYKLLKTDFVSGERVLPREVFDDDRFFKNCPGFGLEVKLNKKIIAKGYTIQNIFLEGVITPRKSTKYGFLLGIGEDFKMLSEILSVISFREIFYQLWYFSRFHSR